MVFPRHNFAVLAVCVFLLTPESLFTKVGPGLMVGGVTIDGGSGHLKGPGSPSLRQSPGVDSLRMRDSTYPSGSTYPIEDSFNDPVEGTFGDSSEEEDAEESMDSFNHRGGDAPPLRGGDAPPPRGGDAPPPRGGDVPPPRGGDAPPPRGGDAPPPRGRGNV